MKYVTGLYLPDPYEEKHPSISGRFAKRGRRKIHLIAEEAKSRLEISQRILGDEMCFVLDPGLKRHPNGVKAYDILKAADLNIVEIDPLPNEGVWLKKWHLTRALLNRFSEEVLWFDSIDSIVKSKFTEKEVSFLCDGREIVLESQIFRCFGEAPHFSDGRRATKRVKQPQTSIYVLSNEDVATMAIETKIDHDQISLMHVFEKRYNIYQDSPISEWEKFSARGLFKVLPDESMSKIITRNIIKYEPRIFHKCGY